MALNIQHAAAIAHREELLGHPAFLLRRAFQIYAGLFEQQFEQLDLVPAQWSVLVAVNSFPGLTVGEVARAMAIDKTTAARACRQLVARKLLSLTVSPADAREKRLALTDAGEMLCDKAFSASERLREALLGSLDGGQVSALLEGLRTFVEVNDHHGRAPFGPIRGCDAEQRAVLVRS